MLLAWGALDLAQKLTQDKSRQSSPWPGCTTNTVVKHGWRSDDTMVGQFLSCNEWLRTPVSQLFIVIVVPIVAHGSIGTRLIIYCTDCTGNRVVTIPCTFLWSEYRRRPLVKKKSLSRRGSTYFLVVMIEHRVLLVILFKKTSIEPNPEHRLFGQNMLLIVIKRAPIYYKRLRAGTSCISPNVGFYFTVIPGWRRVGACPPQGSSPLFEPLDP